MSQGELEKNKTKGFLIIIFLKFLYRAGPLVYFVNSYQVFFLTFVQIGQND